MESTSLTRFTLQPQVAPHHLHETGGNRKTKSGAAVLPRYRRVGLREGLENSMLLFEGNSDARVHDGKMKQPFGSSLFWPLHCERNPTLRCEFYGILHQI